MLISRRRFMSTSLAGMCAMTLSGCATTAQRTARAGRPPNVLFIGIDDLNDWVGCLGGHPDTRTPHLDRLAGRGTLFTRAYCAAPTCNPSRAALLTGIRPSTSGIYRNNQPMRLSPVLRDAVTLPQHFRAAGYHAIGAGKIIHDPDPQSWDDYWPSPTMNRPQDPVPTSQPAGSKGDFTWGALDHPVRDMGDHQVADWVIEQLNRKHAQPLFLGCGFFRPHLPWHVPGAYFDRFPLEQVTLPTVKEDDLDDVPPAGRERVFRSDHERITAAGAWRDCVRAYLASISFVDDMVGRVLDAFDRSPLRDNTIIVLWSDHGWHLGQKLHWRKFALWEHATRNLLAVAAPRGVAPNARCGAPVNLLDLYPTLVELCGLPSRPQLEGDSLVPLLRHPGAARVRPSLSTYRRGNHALRSQRWRYIRYADGSEELYDHQNDPLEWRNRAADPACTGVKASLARWLPEVDAADSPSRSSTAEASS